MELALMIVTSEKGNACRHHLVDRTTALCQVVTDSLLTNNSKFLGQLIPGFSTFIPSCLTYSEFMNSCIFALVN
ncbi:hypothetical protein EB796_017725 [Bugula neritina]|uniref:Uncharacterized protein n=1 Tax=Bugula neritina TaxID=10212 RepID=A0A7J7JCQ4_BUGNE|nr:hypothetical protein EB796_017725 [Bugula neritina]